MDDEDLPLPLVFPAACRWQRPRRPPILIATVKLPEPPGPFYRLPTALRRMMAARHLSQSELARRIGIPQPKISQYLSGGIEPTITTLGKMLDGMGATAWELVEALEHEARRW